MYWLCFAVKPSATLENLDTYLRGIWLECCGHLSEFYFILGEEVSMSKKVHAILDEVGTRINYIYDWGSSTELVVRLEREVVAAPDKRVCLVARNEPPTWKCDECDEVATMVCTECHSEGDGFCCPVHAETHECGEDMLLPVVNSPRMGVCAYEGDEGEEGEE
jgi:hypothetical protein